MTVQTFRRRPEQVQAVQWRGDNAEEMTAFAGPDFDYDTEGDGDAALRTSKHSAWEPMYLGDWAVRGPGGLARVDAADFAAQFEPDSEGDETDGDREFLGRLVRETWVTWAREQPDPKPSWLLGWNELDDGQREVDMRIGEAIEAWVLGRAAQFEPDEAAAPTVLPEPDYLPGYPGKLAKRPSMLDLLEAAPRARTPGEIATYWLDHCGNCRDAEFYGYTGHFATAAHAKHVPVIEDGYGPLAGQPCRCKTCALAESGGTE